MSPVHVGMIEALVGAIGESDAEIGGFFQTRLTSAVPTGAALAATLTWNGTTTITLANTSELTEGAWVRLNSDGQYFQIETIVPNTSLVILNPYGRAIPTGSGTSSKAITTFPVETTLDWDTEGKIGVGGVLYHYRSKTDTAFKEVFFLAGGEIIPGPANLLRAQSTVIDLNKSRSGIDLVRRAMLVDYAEGNDLNALARNLGVLRLPFISGDEKFRDILKALAYNPKGTMFGLELALAGLVGAGNFQIYEDLIQYPCTVFVRLLGSTVLSSQSQGKTYLSGQEIIKVVNPLAIPIAYPIKARGQVHHIYWAGEDRVTDCRTAKPTADLLREYPGAGLTPAWAYQGDGTEAGQVTQIAGEAIEIIGTVPATETRYTRSMRASPKGTVRIEAVVAKLAGYNEVLRTAALTVADGGRGMSAIIFGNAAGTALVGLVPAVTGPFAAPTVSVQINRTDYHTISLEKYQDVEWRLFVDNELVDRVPYASGAVTAWTRVLFGASGVVPTTMAALRVKAVSIWARDATDYASARGNAGVLTNPGGFNTGGYLFYPDDEGKTLVIEKSAVSNVAGGNNNGRWIIQPGAAGFAACTLAGAQNVDADTSGASATRIVLPTTGPQFHFPDDLGRTITITGSTLGNNGTWTIAQLLDPNTLVDLSLWKTQIPMATNVCEVSGASFVPETGLGWELHPDFSAEGSLEWQLPGSIDVVGQSISLRGGLPAMDVGMLQVLAITYSQVLSAGILPDASAENEVTQEVPDLWFRYYPFYLADPWGFVRTYLSEITAAGVIPDFQII